MALTAQVYVDPSVSAGVIDPNIYGQFLSRRRWVVEPALYAPGHPDAAHDGIRRQVRAAIAAIRPAVIRWPGGCTGTTYQWQDGIGPSRDRPRSMDWHFGYDVDNGFGTAEFIDFCRSVGAEPQINLPLGTGTLADALNWYEYVKATGPSRWAQLRRSHGFAEPWDVKYWQIGNEEWGEWEIGHRSAQAYAPIAREWGKAIKKLDPSTRVIAVGDWRTPNAMEWNQEVLRTAWRYIDYITAHIYWRFNPAEADGGYERTLAVAYDDDLAIGMYDGLIGLIARELGSQHRPQMAITEWNAGDQSHRQMSPGWRPGRTQYRLVDALTCAGFLNAMQRHCRVVGLANFAQTINVVGALVVTDDAVVRESVYWALYLQRNHSGSVSISSRVDCDGQDATLPDGRVLSVPYLDVSATRDESGTRMWLSIVNRHRTEEVVARIRLQDIAPQPTANSWELWTEDPLTKNTQDAPDAISPREASLAVAPVFELPLKPHSYTVLEVSLSGRA